MRIHVLDYRDFSMDFNDYNTISPDKRKKKKYTYDYECDDIFTFDIEVSSAWIDGNGNIKGYEKGKKESYWNDMKPICLCYIWQFGVNDTVYYGRDLHDFPKLLDKLPKNVHIIVYIHNASYEFQFLLNILSPFQQVFARNVHKPIKFVSEAYPNIEFRCSYMLTRLSLDTWGKELGFEKLHTLDYYKIRTPKTVLEQKELDYAERDCMVMYKGLLKYKERYLHIWNIPLTQTGEVRRVVKKKMRTDPKTGKTSQKLLQKYVKLLPKDSAEYTRLKCAFRGGDTHANFLLAGEIWENAHCYDFASSYPYCMLAEKYPMTPFTEDDYDEEMADKYAYLMLVEFTNVQAKTFNHYIAKSKCLSCEKAETDNGRIISAKRLTLWLTEQDLQIIKKTYSFNVNILECYSSRKMYLPKQFLEYILELYSNKTQLKGVEGKEEIYMQSKQFINSLYGMCVTDLLQDEILLDNDGNWNIALKTTQDVDAYLEELRTNNKGRTFLSFAWGVWVTAYGRAHLWELITQNDENVIYYDTDSIKCIGKPKGIVGYNKKVVEKLKAVCEKRGLDFEKCKPKDPKGNEHLLGIADVEPTALEFKTLGAKRYCYRSEKDGELHLTVAGINKEAVACLNNDINNFNENTVFDKDTDGVRKLQHTYIHDMPQITWNEGRYDEWTSIDKFGINMRPAGYSMTLVDEYLRLITMDEIDKLKCLSVATAQHERG